MKRGKLLAALYNLRAAEGISLPRTGVCAPQLRAWFQVCGISMCYVAVIASS